MRFTCSALLLILAVKFSLCVVAIVQSGDFLVFTNNSTGSTYTSTPIEGSGEYGVAVLSPTGSLRKLLKIPYYNEGNLLGYYLASLALSPDGKYAFVSATLPGKGKEMSIVVVRIKGNDPKVLHTIALPSSTLCAADGYSAAIAAGPGSSDNNYDIYVARECYDGLPNDKYSKVTSTDVLKLRYTVSTGKLEAFAKKPYSRRNKLHKCYYSSSVTTLRVIHGVAYGILTVVEEAACGPTAGRSHSTQNFQLLRLGSKKARASIKLRNEDLCRTAQFTFTSTSQFYGVCAFRKSGRDAVRLTVISARGNKITRGPLVPLNDTNGPLMTPKYNWEGSLATGQKSSDIYAVLADQTADDKKTLYKISSKFDGPPQKVFEFPQSVVAKTPARDPGQYIVPAGLEIINLFVVP